MDCKYCKEMKLSIVAHIDKEQEQAGIIRKLQGQLVNRDKQIELLSAMLGLDVIDELRNVAKEQRANLISLYNCKACNNELIKKAMVKWAEDIANGR